MAFERSETEALHLKVSAASVSRDHAKLRSFAVFSSPTY